MMTLLSTRFHGNNMCLSGNNMCLRGHNNNISLVVC